LALDSYRLSTSPSDQYNHDVRTWHDRLHGSLPKPDPHRQLKQGSGVGADAGRRAETDDSDEDADETTGGICNDQDQDGAETDALQNQGLPDAAVPLGLIANLSLSSNKSKIKAASNGAASDDDDDDVVWYSSYQCFISQLTLLLQGCRKCNVLHAWTRYGP
jgi:hypothetical protein